jgi:hypothetical protein
MPILNLPDTIEIPFDSLTNEQRSAIHTVMTGKGLINPLTDKIRKCRSAVRKELEIMRGFTLASPPPQGGDCPTCPLTECSQLIQQQRVEVAYQLELLLYWLDAFEIHTDKLSGSKVEFIDTFFQRLSTAGSYTSALKSITGDNKEKFSFIFKSLMGDGDICLDRILNDFWGNCAEGTICGTIASTSGVVGMAEWLCKGTHANEVITCFLPSLINCIKNLTETDDLNYCQARKVIERYAASQRLTSDALNDPIIGTIIKKIFATPALTDALRELENAELSEDFLETTQRFFPEFTDDSDDTNCVGSPLVVVGEPGIQGETGTDGCRGPQGLPGPPGTDGSCDLDCPPCGETLGACCINGFCLEVTNNQCAFYSGNYYGDETDCSIAGNCIPENCGGNQDCIPPKICCGAQCVEPCANAGCGGGCPPCAPFPFPCCNGCGGGECCEEPNICCNGSCVGGCPGGGCPDCQGSCCPAGTSCCGSDGCCPDGGCCGGECCSGDTPNCCNGVCSSSGNGEGCCGNGGACSAGQKCCGDPGSCCPNPNGEECCNGECPCGGDLTCCPDGCKAPHTNCPEADPCQPEPLCCGDQQLCDDEVHCCDEDETCCEYEPDYCCDAGQNCTTCGCCDPEECCVDGVCVPKCDEGGCPSCGVGIEAECCDDFNNCATIPEATCQTDCKADDSGCCDTGTPYFVDGACEQACPCDVDSVCPPRRDPSSPCGIPQGCPCSSGTTCCPDDDGGGACCDDVTEECCEFRCIDKCVVWDPDSDCGGQSPDYVEKCEGACLDDDNGCCEARGGECCGGGGPFSLGNFSQSIYCCNKAATNTTELRTDQCCPVGFHCCSYTKCLGDGLENPYGANNCGDGFRGFNHGGPASPSISLSNPKQRGPITPDSSGIFRTCCLDGVETCGTNGCHWSGDSVALGGGPLCVIPECPDYHKLCHCETKGDVEIPYCGGTRCAVTSSEVSCIHIDEYYDACPARCGGGRGDDEGACCFDFGNCRNDLTQEQCETGANIGEWMGVDSTCEMLFNCSQVVDEECRNTQECASGLECCFVGTNPTGTCQNMGECPEAPPTGRCCSSPTNECSITIESQCQGSWKMNAPCPAECGDPCFCLPPPECVDNNGCETWQDCIDGVCTDVDGACCQIENINPYEDPICLLLTAPVCGAADGYQWQGKDTICEPGRCSCNYGTCCNDIGTLYLCSDCLDGEVSGTCRDDCENNSGTWTPCTYDVCGTISSQCQPFGACCLSNNSCEEVYKSNCEEGLGGTFMGDDTVCTDADGDGVADICETEPQYCCCCDGCKPINIDGTCNSYGESCCEVIEGECNTGSNCGNAPSLCDEPGECGGTPEDDGACCYPDYRNCNQESFDECGGDWQGYATDCNNNLCTLYSACCESSGSCTENTTQTNCVAGGGDWQGINASTSDGFTCAEVDNCEPEVTGACCFCPSSPIDITPGPCIIRTEEQCDSLGNRYTYKGDGTDCQPGSCGRPEGCCPTCLPPPVEPDPGWCCVCDTQDGIFTNNSNGTIKCGGCGDLNGQNHLGECPGEGKPCSAPCCQDGGVPCTQSNTQSSTQRTGVITKDNSRNRQRSQSNLPVSPCGPNKEFCVDENGTGKCCKQGEVCCNGNCVPADARGVCAYSSVTEKYYHCPTGYCKSLAEDGRVVCRNTFGDSSNCPEAYGQRRYLPSRTNSIERTYSAFRTYTQNRDVILQKNFDDGGRLDNYFIVVRSRPVIGRQNELATQTTITGTSASTDKPQQIITAPVNFQIVNYVADDKIKTEARPTGNVGGVFKTRGSTDTQSKISKAELNDSPKIGQAGYERGGARAQTIKGSLTATINNGVLGDAQVMTFVSGSNIRLDTNTEKNFIRINVDDLNLWELVDVDDGASAANNNDVLQYQSSSGLWKAVAVATGATGTTGATGPVAGSDKQVLFNYGAGPSGSPRLTFDYSTNSFNVGSGVTANFSGGISAGATCEFNDNFVHNAKLNDYSERVTALGTISSTPYIINIENGNVQTLTVGGNFTAVFLNPPASGAAGSLTLIITNGASSTLTWPSSVKWSSGAAPSLSSSGTDIVSFTTIDAGTTWYGFVGGIGFS